jgi:hypothetical protein
MPRRGYQRKTCKDCGGERSEIGHVTWRGYCLPCGQHRAVTEVNEMRAHSGPHFEHWRRSMAASVGGVLLDDVRVSE